MAGVLVVSLGLEDQLDRPFEGPFEQFGLRLIDHADRFGQHQRADSVAVHRAMAPLGDEHPVVFLAGQHPADRLENRFGRHRLSVGPGATENPAGGN